MYKTRHDINQLRTQAKTLDDDIEHFTAAAETCSSPESTFLHRLITQLQHEQDLMNQLADSWSAREMGSQVAFAMADCFQASPAPDTLEVAEQAIELVTSRFIPKTSWKH
jgi:CHAD domain-containing protein